ncbi:MAG: DUF3263 domain-containing protein [Nakamurella sp.]
MDSAAAAERSGDNAPVGLTETEREILHFEKQWWQYPGTKEKTIREIFALSPTRYYQLLNEVIDKPAALVADPLLVRRLRRLRASRQKARSARRFGIQL